MYQENRLHTTLSQQPLSSFMFMAVEKEILYNIDVEDIIDCYSMKRLFHSDFEQLL